MPAWIHVSAFQLLRPLPKEAVADGEFLELRERRVRNRLVCWEATLPVYDAQGNPNLGALHIIAYPDARTLWAVVWKINNKAVAKLDAERVGKRNLPVIADAKGRLNSRAGARIQANLPHWMFVDTETGELEDIHRVDRRRFPPRMPLAEALVKWCKDELNLDVFPQPLRIIRPVVDDKEKRWVPLDSPDLFSDT
jgi:hypothetical protein